MANESGSDGKKKHNEVASKTERRLHINDAAPGLNAQGDVIDPKSLLLPSAPANFNPRIVCQERALLIIPSPNLDAIIRYRELRSLYGDSLEKPKAVLRDYERSFSFYTRRFSPAELERTPTDVSPKAVSFLSTVGSSLSKFLTTRETLLLSKAARLEAISRTDVRGKNKINNSNNNAGPAREGSQLRNVDLQLQNPTLLESLGEKDIELAEVSSRLLIADRQEHYKSVSDIPSGVFSSPQDGYAGKIFLVKTIEKRRKVLNASRDTEVPTQYAGEESSLISKLDLSVRLHFCSPRNNCTKKGSITSHLRNGYKLLLFLSSERLSRHGMHVYEKMVFFLNRGLGVPARHIER